MRQYLLALAVLATTSAAHTSTFVGNGGNAGDVEWQVTLRQIQSGLDGIQKDPPDDELLCSCDETYSNSGICDALNSLTSEQRRMCGATLKGQITQLKPLIRDNNTVHVTWTTDKMDVLENGHRRAVDAVTDRTQGRVTLNADQFRAMNPSERVFLISHELMHLTTLNGKPLTDDGAQGPFTSNEGSRQLINAMAAALTIEANEAGAFNRYQSTLNRPQGWKTNWLELSFAHPSASGSTTYAVQGYQDVNARLTHYFSDLSSSLGSNFGLNIEYESMKGSKNVLTTIKVDETIGTARAGLSYRIFPFRDPLTFFGQSNVVFSADVDFVHGSMSLSDAYPDNNRSATSDRVGGSAAIRWQIPIALGFWVSVGEAYESLAGAYNIYGVNIDNDKNVFSTSLGASYAF